MQFILPSYETICDIHEIVLKNFGGLQGIPHPDYIDSVLHRPENYMAYDITCDIHLVAALILDGIARNHAFADGNKRTALISMLMVYNLNKPLSQNLSFSLHMNEGFELLVLKVAEQKPPIQSLRKELKALIEKFEA